MNNSSNGMNLTGLFVKRKNIPNPIIQDIYKELLLYLFEAQIVIKSFQHLENKDLAIFDGNVGDAKCQTRASMLINIYSQKKQLLTESNLIKKEIENFIHKIQGILQENDFENHLFIKNNIKKFQYKEMSDFIKKYDLNLFLPKDIIIPALCMITKLSRYEIHALTNNKISKQAIDKFQELSKIQLCELSMQYEHDITSCRLSEEKIGLSQIESKKYSSNFLKMTSFFLGFKPIFEKMKIEKDPFLQRITYFCKCNGIIQQLCNLYTPQNNIYTKIEINSIDKNKVIMIIDGISYPGSLETLKHNLLVPMNKSVIPKEYQKPCTCNSEKIKNNDNNNIEEIILANFAQHSQFTNGAEIDWKKLGLEDSNLKKEFDHLKTIPGCSIDDMSTFCIRHIYPSTIADVLKEQKEMEEKLQAERK